MSKSDASASSGFVLNPEERVGLLDIINAEGDLGSIAAEVGCSPITICKAVGGHPISAQTVLQVQRYLDDESFYDDAEADDDDEDFDDAEEEEND